MTDKPVVFIVDDDASVRDALALLFDTAGIAVEAYPSAEAFLQAYRPDRRGCLVLDVQMPGLSGLELQTKLAELAVRLPIIFLTAHGNIPASVRAIKAGAVDFLEKPADGALLLERVQAALRDSAPAAQGLDAAIERKFEHLTLREREVMARVAAGMSSKEIARVLGISHRTVEVHRARLMQKMGARTVLDLAAMAEALGLGRRRTI